MTSKTKTMITVPNEIMDAVNAELKNTILSRSQYFSVAAQEKIKRDNEKNK
jgi:metal-responsive CopG/Arc/MetJ family transcriptional regulator|tara:strand:- start:487 stop:639 length:153 start_codon:yes stop_codon:yes gene_type:complete